LQTVSLQWSYAHSGTAAGIGKASVEGDQWVAQSGFELDI